VSPLIGRIARHDPDLARQLRRASASVVLNTAEGMYARGRDFDRRARFTALRERNGEDARLVREGLPSGSFGSVERGARRALSSLLPKLSVCDANPRHELNERKRELISDEPMMR